MKFQHILGLLFLFGPMFLVAQFESEIVFQDSLGRMNYLLDEEGNRIPDFSHAGYEGGGVALPEVPIVMTISPIAGDNTAHLQAAIDQVSAMNPDSNGFRGALLLEAGRYEIHGILRVAASGVVLRGVGDGADTAMNTVLMGVGNSPNQRDLVVVGGDDPKTWFGRVDNTAGFISSERVLVGEYKIKVEHPEFYAPGDNVVINHPCTQEWLDAIGGGGGVTEGPWAVGSQPLIFNRRIVSIEDSTLTLDVPLYNTLDKSLSPTFVYVHDREGMVSQVGVENLRIDIETLGGDDEAHAWNALKLQRLEDAWVKNCTFLHFGLAGVITHSATRVTVDSCQALDPVAQVTGARMYNFNLIAASSRVLVKDCYARNGRHHYVSNGTSSVSGCVFLNCISDAAYAASEGHRRWSMGLLYDNLVEVNVRDTDDILLGLYNRGDYGTAHGWSSAHSVAWNCSMAGARLIVQKPPTSQNYAIACRGQVGGVHRFPGPVGYIEGTGETDLAISSLYQAQLNARLGGLEEVVIERQNTNIPKVNFSSSWQVYPNPSSGILRIEAPTSAPFSGRILDLSGKTLGAFTGQGSWQGRFEELPKGSYLIHLHQSDQSYWHRWIKK